MIDLNKKTFLIIAPHPDDEVIGCGGLISKIKSLGGKVFVLYLTVGTTQDFGKRGVSTAEARINEIKKVTKFLKIDGWKIAFPGGEFHLQLDSLPQKKLIHEIERGEKISLETLKPDIIAFPSVGDYNQDHQAASSAAFSACRPSTKQDKFVPDLILSYEAPMNQWTQEAHRINFFVQLDKKDFAKKTAALDLYKSQVRRAPHLRSRAVLEALAKLRGSVAGTNLAEGFYCHKLNT